MNNIKYIVIIILAVLSASCEDFLDLYPKNTINDVTFWQKTSDLELYCNAYYGAIPGSGIASTDRNSDLYIHSTITNEVLCKRTIPATDNIWSWGNIRKFNIFLANYTSAQGDADEINVYVGEIKFFRALDYWNKVKKFGNVPWFSKELDPENEEDIFKSRDSRKMVMDSVMADLDAAIQYLPLKGKEKTGRIHREYALAWKARIALYEGTWRKYHQGTIFGVEGNNGDALLQQAADAAKEIIDGDKFQIVTGDTSKTYNELFITNDLRNHPEMIFIRRYIYPEKKHSTSYNLFQGNGNGLSKNAVDMYLCTDGKPISISDDYLGDDVLEDELSYRDPRLLQTIAYPNTDIATGDVSPALPGMGNPYTTSGYFIRKWYLAEQNGYNMQETDIPVCRYAEVLLIYAEAKAELGEITQQDLDVTINILRDRVNMPHLTINPPADPENMFAKIGMDLNPIIVEVRRERAVELMLEGKRWDDILRWRAGKLIDQDYKGIKWAPGRYPDFTLTDQFLITEDGYIQLPSYAFSNRNKWNEDRDYLYPLPSDELSKYPEGIITQNPGWE